MSESTTAALDEKSEAEEPAPPAKTEVHFESSLPIEEAVSYFEAIVAGLKKGTLNLKQSDSALTLNPPAFIDVEVKAVRKKDKERISFELAWRSPSDSDLTITSA